MANNSSVAIVSSAWRCTGCAICSAICPQNAILMKISTSGYLLANVDERKCSSCGLCLKICPVARCEDTKGSQIDSIGSIAAAYVGYATEPDIRSGGQSGGVATSILSALLNAKNIDNALVSVMPGNGTLRPVPEITRTRDGLLAAQGSKYCQVPLWSSIAQIDRSCRLGVVALPCQTLALRNAQQQFPEKFQAVKSVIGLICAQVFTYGAIDSMVKMAGISRDAVKSLRFRDKTVKEGTEQLVVESFDGKKVVLPSWYRYACKQPFVPVCCRLCYDKVNRYSDIALGDTWGMGKDHKNCSLIIVRNEEGKSALNETIKQGLLKVQEIDPSVAIKNQKITERIRDYQGYTQAWFLINGTSLTAAQSLSIKDNKNTSVQYLKKLKRLLLIAKQENRSTYEHLVGKWMRELYHNYLFRKIKGAIIRRIVLK